MIKKKLPADIDRLMWLIAEEGDLRAADEFEQRFPDLKLELSKRIAMLKGLKKSKTDRQTTTSDIPAFKPRAAAPVRPAPMRRVLVLAALFSALGAIAAGSFMVASKIARETKTVTVENPVKAPRQAPPQSPSDPKQLPNQQVPDSRLQDPPQQNPNAVPPIDDRSHPWLQPRDLMVPSASLHSVLQLIAAQASMTLEIAPNTPDPEVSADYRNVSALDMLRDLGRKHGFTVFPQEQGHVLIVPAVEGGAQPDSDSRPDTLDPTDVGG